MLGIIKTFKLSAEEFNSCELKAYQVEALETVLEDILISYTQTEIEQFVNAAINEQTVYSLRDFLLNGHYDSVLQQLQAIARQNFN